MNLKNYTAPQIKKSKITNSRQHAISLFVERINTEREKNGYKKLPPKFFAVKMGHVKTSELHWFFQTCDNYKGDFSQAWFGMLKTKTFNSS